MSVLMRAPRECGSWFWEIDGAGDGLGPALEKAARAAEVLGKSVLLKPLRIEYDWYVSGRGGIAVKTTLGLRRSLDDPELPALIRQTRPSGFPEAEVSSVRVLGSGVWFDATGSPRWEPGLVDLEVSPEGTDVTVEVSVHHDIWKFYDFFGLPHPELRDKNAPRLADALRHMEKAFGLPAETGEPTYFGVAEGYGIATPDASKDGKGPDLTDKF